MAVRSVVCTLLSSPAAQEYWTQAIKKKWLQVVMLIVGVYCVIVAVIYFNPPIPNMATSNVEIPTATSTPKPPTFFRASLPKAPLKCTGRYISEPPNMLVLQKIGIFEKLTSEKDAVGTILLEDYTGKKMERIRDDELKTTRINQKVFQTWLEGKGRQPISWRTLIDVLFEVKSKVLAEKISKKVKRQYCKVPSHVYDYSSEILQTAKKLRYRYRKQKIVEFELLEKFNTEKLPFFDLILRDHEEHHIGTSDKVLNNVLRKATVHKRLLITGPPGSGKTTLLRYIAKTWAEGNGLQTCQILFVIHMGRSKNSDYTCLSDLLSKHYRDITDIKTVSREISSKYGNETCILLDAFDEKSIKIDYINNLMFNNELPNSICIMTSRPDSDLKAINLTINIGGFKLDKLDSYLQLSTNKNNVKEKVMKLWKDKEVKELCQLPLHMAMILFIAQTTHASSIKTKTQIYTAFMNATIMHYEHDHPEWNTVSLRQCVLGYNTPHHGEDELLCNAFKIMHLEAFKMIFESSFVSSIDSITQTKMKSLGFVSIISQNSVSDEVKLSFSHPTFTEFFAALHLITLPQSDQLFHVQNPMIKKKTGLIDFYFGLLGDMYANNISVLSLALKQYSAAFAYPLHKWEHDCPHKFYTAQSSSTLRLHQEIGWKGEVYRELLDKVGIVINSSVCLSISNSTTGYLSYLLENHGKINKISVVDYSASFRVILLNSNTRYPLNLTHLRLLECFNSFRDDSCRRDELRSSVQHIHLRTDETSFQTTSDFGSTIHWLSIFHQLNSFGLSIHTSSLINSPDIMLRNLNVLRLEIHCCVKELRNLLMSFPNITTLYLELLPECASQVQLQDITMLLNALRKPERLQNLILVPTSEINVPVFLTGLTALRYLHIEKMNINGSTASQLIEVASKNLEILDLSHCKLQGLAVKKLSTNLQSFSNLRNLKFVDAGLSDTDVSTLSESIRKLSKLSYLDLSDNSINGEGLQSLVEVLKEISSFRSLNLFGNPITGKENIIALSQMTHLHTLHISISSNEDKHALIRVVRHLKQLESFRWSLL